MSNDEFDVLESPPFHKKTARQTLELLHKNSDCFEIRAIGDKSASNYEGKQTYTGFFDDIEKALLAIQKHHGTRQVCIGLNPRTLDLFHAVARNEMATGVTAGKDEDVSAIKWVMIDLDPKRRTGTSATDEELAKAKEVAESILKLVRDFENIPFIHTLSGNGYHILIPVIDTTASDIRAFLAWLKHKYGTQEVEIDQSTYNPGRLIKVAGTAAKKGQNTSLRPWRTSRILEVHGDVGEAIPLAGPFQEEIEDGYAQLNSNGVNTSELSKDEDPLVMIFKDKDLYIRPQVNGHHLVRCPWADEHSSGKDGDSSTVLMEGLNRLIGFKCHHSHCSKRTTKDVREFFKDELGRFGRKDLNIRTRIEKYIKSEPKPMETEAFNGIAGDLIDLFEPKTEADKHAILVQFLVAIGNVMGRMPYVPMESSRHYPNLFALIVGDTSKARKGTSWNHIRRLLTLVNGPWVERNILNGLATGEGLINAVRDQTKIQKEKKDRGNASNKERYEEVIVDAGVMDKRLLVIASEFVSVISTSKRVGNILSPTLRNAWDSGVLESPTKTTPIKATNPHISVIGHITQAELRSNLDQVSLLNGLGNRFLLVFSKRTKELPFGGDIDEGALEGIAERLALVIEHALDVQEVTFSSSGKKLWAHIYSELSSPREGLFGAVTARAEAQVLRLSLLYSLLDNSTVIKPSHIVSALAVWEYCEQSAFYLFGDTGSDELAEDILTFIEDQPEGVTRTNIRDFLGRNQSRQRIESILANLITKQKVRMEKRNTGGKPSEVWISNLNDQNDKTQKSNCRSYVKSAREFMKSLKSERMANNESNVPPIH